jgi:hypothetical protein
MKKQFTIYGQLFMLSILLTGLTACKKQDDFLAAKPNTALAVPSTLADLQSLLQNESLFNSNDPSLGQISSDDGYVSTNDWNNLSGLERNGYIWNKTVYDAGANVADWSVPYQQVYYANVVLDALKGIKSNPSNQSWYNQIMGSALFYRSIAFYNLLQNFSGPYRPGSAGTDLGIPLRLNSDLNIKSVRASQQQCYDQVTADLKTALALLPVTPAYKTEPSQPAANALLARVYLTMDNYPSAFQYADACLKQNNLLVDYNTLQPSARSISKTYLAEDIYHTRMTGYAITIPVYVSVTDSVLYASYKANDLRKSVFFILKNGLPYFRGTYDFKRYTYSGIATDEIYLIRAECNARMQNMAAAMNDLNALLTTRWKTGTFVPYTAVSPDDALGQILLERRKELLYRGIRWVDLRRLNQDPRFAITLTRVINGQTYTLPPNDPRYAWPIPDNEIEGSGIQQNSR